MVVSAWRTRPALRMSTLPLRSSRRRAANLRQPISELALPVFISQVKALDAECGDVDGQWCAGLVEYRTWQRRSACRLNALSLINSDFQKIADKSFVGVGTHECKGIASLRGFEASFGFPRPVG